MRLGFLADTRITWRPGKVQPLPDSVTTVPTGPASGHAVSDEAGLGVVPATQAGRRFRDELGRLNQALAAESEETELIVAGRVLPLSAC